MNTNHTHGRILQQIREEAKLTQAEVAQRMPFTSSRVSRLESGELSLNPSEAVLIAKAIGSSLAMAYAEFLSWDWRVLEAPSFSHCNRDDLWKAEQALQRLDNLKADPELKNAFLKQVDSCQAAIIRAAKYLQSVDHPVVYIGPPSVGKTTAICAVTDGLRDLSETDLSKQMALHTGSGRTTICEVGVRRGGEYTITVDPCSDQELRYYVTDFCDHLINQSFRRSGKAVVEGAGISAEMERIIRNLTGLTVKKNKGSNSKYTRHDPALELVSLYPNKEDLRIEVLARMNLPRRQRTSIVYPKGSSLPAMKWLSRTFAEINFGRHPDFSLPSRIEVAVPGSFIGAEEFSVRLIDTRGIDEPSSPRRDLQSYLDDDRAIIVLCSQFGDAPSAAVQAVIERARDSGICEALMNRGMLLILTKDGEAEAILSDETGEPVYDIEEGCDIRREQVQSTTLTDLGVGGLELDFMNVKDPDDCERMRDVICARIGQIRQEVAQQINDLARTTDHLIENKTNEQMRLVFVQAVKPLQLWLESNMQISGKPQRLDDTLPNEIDGLRYASSLRASVNRRGDWHNFNYWDGLGHGARRIAVARTKEQTTKLNGILENLLSDIDLIDAHDFLRHFISEFNIVTSSFFVDVQQLGETAFSEQLREDNDYWHRCQSRWGLGSGYKLDIRSWTGKWFESSTIELRHQFVESEIQRRWEAMLAVLSDQLMLAPSPIPASG